MSVKYLFRVCILNKKTDRNRSDGCRLGAVSPSFKNEDEDEDENEEGMFVLDGDEDDIFRHI